MSTLKIYLPQCFTQRHSLLALNEDHPFWLSLDFYCLLPWNICWFFFPIFLSAHNSLSKKEKKWHLSLSHPKFLSSISPSCMWPEFWERVPIVLSTFPTKNVIIFFVTDYWLYHSSALLRFSCNSWKNKTHLEKITSCFFIAKLT